MTVRPKLKPLPTTKYGMPLPFQKTPRTSKKRGGTVKK
jgi:hypothetical protein